MFDREKRAGKVIIANAGIALMLAYLIDIFSQNQVFPRN